MGIEIDGERFESNYVECPAPDCNDGTVDAQEAFYNDRCPHCRRSIWQLFEIADTADDEDESQEFVPAAPGVNVATDGGQHR